MKIDKLKKAQEILNKCGIGEEDRIYLFDKKGFLELCELVGVTPEQEVIDHHWPDDYEGLVMMP